MEPKIRLKGFEGEWVKAPFSEIANRASASASSLNYPGVEFEDINSGEGTLNKDVSRKKIVKIGKLFSEGDVLFGKLRPYLKNILLADFKGVAIGDFWVLRPQKVTSELLYILLNSREFMRIANISSGSKMPRADWNLVSSTPFAYPETKEEQDAIGAYFQYLESMIQSTTKKIESLKQVKAASLQTMFPQEGETSPRVRFKGFEGEWNVVTLGEVGTFKSNGVDKLVRPDEKMINLLNYLDVYNSRQINKENCNSLMQVSASDRQIIECDVQKNDIFFTPSSETAEDIGYVLVMKDTLPNTCYSYHLMRYRPNEGVFFEDFPNYGFTTKYVREQMRLLAKGVQRFVIGKTEFESIKVQIPSYQEQKKIADYFRSLDSQIIGQTQRLEKLKQIKSACLDNMFV